MKAAFFTFGCTVNHYETQKMRESFEAEGFLITDAAEADIIIINTCAVTSSAEKNAEDLLRRMRKKNPDTFIAFAGCYGEMLIRKNMKARADLVVGNDKSGIVRRILAEYRGPAKPGLDYFGERHITAGNRAYLMIQNGCACGCAYCVVPRLRGKPVSRPYDEIMRELSAITSLGRNEIIIAGINIGKYDRDGKGLADVLAAVNSQSGVRRVRLSSLEPVSTDGRFINTLPKLDKLAPHFHLSLQSGCDRTLSRMNRSYTFTEYKGILSRIRESVPGAAVTTDIIAGFPGETDHDFKSSCENIAACGFADLHIFRYSKREGTTAFEMDNQIAERRIDIRAATLEGIRTQARLNFNVNFIGKTVKVSVIRKTGESFMEGVSLHGVSVLFGAGKNEHTYSTEPGYADVSVAGFGKDSGTLTGDAVFR